MRRIVHAWACLFLASFLAMSFAGCSSSEKWTKNDFNKYSRETGGGKFTLKCFAVTLNLKLGMICEEYIDSRFSLDILPVREIKSYMEKKYGAAIDITEFEQLRKTGGLKIEVIKNQKKKKEVLFNPDHILLDGMTVGLGRYTIGGSTWIRVAWTEYKGKVGAISFMDRVEMGKSPQMQVYIGLSPMTHRIIISLKVPYGKPDKNGIYRLKTVAEEYIPTNFELSGCNTAGLAKQIANLPAELAARDRKPVKAAED